MNDREKAMREKTLREVPILQELGITGGTDLCRCIDLLSNHPSSRVKPPKLPELSDEWKKIIAEVKKSS